MEKITLCFIGDFSKNHDEGAKNVLFNLLTELSQNYTIITLDEKKLFSFQFFTTICKSNKPHIIHYFTDPSIFSLLFLKLLSLFWKGSKTIVSALHPDIPVIFRKFTCLLKPDLILVQSNIDLYNFNNYSFKTAFLPNGVNIDKFRPVDSNTNIKLRKKFGIQKDQFLILHVGHIKENRHLEVLEKISDAALQILVIASEYIAFDEEICKKLRESGVIVNIGYIQNIEEIYAVADCYVFPVEENGAITTPLSVLEAMSCNLPVVTRKLPGLDCLFKEEKGLFFADGDQEFIDKIKLIQKGITTNTREMVLIYSWQNIANKLSEIYDNFIISNEGSDVQK
jgi:glycosyltransferase involved in cell wall biosynthesis